jgi:hypothetical protein
VSGPQKPGRAARLRPLAGRIAAAAAVFGAPLLLAGPAHGASLGAAPALGGWNITADGNAVDILIDNATGLAGIHPFSEADFPAAQTSFASGPFGSGLAAVFWPGSAGGNFGSLSSELGFPSQLQPLTSHLNDPLKASAQYPLGPQSATYPAGSSGGAAEMKATAEAGGTTAEAAIANQGEPKLFGFSSARGNSSATASDKALATASSDLNDVSILGLVDIGSVTSTAQAVSNGTTGTGSAVTHVTGVTVLGQPASIGSDGLVLPSLANSVGGLTAPLVQNAISQVISGLGLTVKEFPSTEAASGAGFTATSGGLSIEIDPPSSAAPLLEQAASTLAPLFPSQAAIIPTLPGLLQGMTLTITLGRATASANASTAYVASFNPTIAAPPAPPAGASSSGAPVPAGSFPAGGSGGPAATVSGSPSMAAAPSPAGSAGAPAGSGTSAVPAPGGALVSLSKPLAAGAVALAVLVALAIGYGLWSLGRMLLPRDTDPICPLGQDQP